jgi:hypothetical protein
MDKTLFTKIMEAAAAGEDPQAAVDEHFADGIEAARPELTEEHVAIAKAWLPDAVWRDSDGGVVQ